MYTWLSFWDILSIPELREMVDTDDYGSFYSFLYAMGFDLDRELEYDSCYHRTLTKEIVYAPRVLARERTDKEWLEGGYASDEAWKISVGRKDVSLLAELEEMSKQSSTTGEVIKYLEDYWGSGSDLTRNIEVSC